MKNNWLNIKVIFFLCLSTSVLFAQDKGTYIDSAMINVPASGGADSSESLNFITPCSNFYVKDGKAWIKVDLGENYEYGSHAFGVPFIISMDLDIEVLTDDPSVNPSISFNIKLDNNKPEGLIYLNLDQYIDKANNSTGFSYLNNKVTGIKGIVRNITNTAPSINTSTDLKVNLNYEINYGIDVNLSTVSNLTYKLIPDTKVAVFEWENGCEAPEYEFQILRLYNTNPDTVTDEKIITTNIDWKKALSLSIEGSNPSIDLTLGQGQGYYVWRVRPIGTFYENGIGNDQNWGSWNAQDYGTCTECLFNSSTSTNQVFFFTDPDDDRNFQYNRVFTEKNKVSESVTYATSLNQVKQTQRYIPSKNYKVITQTLLDNSGRPTLNTLPVPVVGERINKYKEGFVTAKGKLYKAEDFDLDKNYKKPAMIDATGAFQYYSSANADKRIPDAEGYPFTRVLFSNDGSDRVIEQSGVGKTHMIGNLADGKTRTTRTLYSTPTEDELVKLFGDEAPNHEDVAKIITIDPNNTRSVSYITKEGKTIATGLTFSEDSDVLDSVKDPNPNNTISGVTDKISNNIKTSNGFMSSKRITILQNGTGLNLSYTIEKQILDGLCSNIEFELDYNLKIEVFDISTGEAIHSFEKLTLKDIKDTTADGIDNIIVDFGAIVLNTGTYYIQKTLIPSDDIKLKVVNAEDSLNKLIKPFFNWIINFSNKIDCEEEMEYLYNDIFHFGQLVRKKGLAAQVKFDCVGCSQETITFLSKDPKDPEADDEFLDYYIGKEDQYSITISYFNEVGTLETLDYTLVSSLGTIKPVRVDFTTPCCSFSVPIVFTPPFKTPTVEAITAYKAGFQNQVLESISYYPNTVILDPLTTPNPGNSISPNPNFLLDDSKNFTYNQDDKDAVTLINTKAYPVDFEGYAISMLYECKSYGDKNYTQENAAEEIYKYMRGWHRPGLLNQMVYHMVTDNYGEKECSRNNAGNQAVASGGSLYETCDLPKIKKYLPGASYTAQELAECWEPIVVEIVNRLCVDTYILEDDGNGNIAESYDEREGNSTGHLKENINNFIVRWIAKRKIIKRMRSQNVSGDGSAKNKAAKEIDNLVNTFLNCTGYSFAEIIEIKYDVNGKKQEPVVLPEDASIYNRNRLAYESIKDPDGNIDWVYFSSSKEDGTVDYIPATGDELNIPESQLRGRIAQNFPNIKDPVFAFKYYEYEDGAFPILEGQTCYRDPNICIDEKTQEEFGCCGEDVDGNPIPCNFCDSGYITCEETKNDWNCEQRFTFYGLIKSYREEVVPATIPINCENYYEASSYVMNPDYDKVDGFVLDFGTSGTLPGTLSDLEYLSENLFVSHGSGGFITNNFSSMPLVTHFTNLKGKTGDGVSIIENDAYEMIEKCGSNCEDRAEEFRTELINTLEERCYIIGDCKIETNDNIVPIGDIDILVEEMIKQCKNQCEIDTFSCIDESCRLLGAPTRVGRTDPTEIDRFTIDISITDYGVSGPVVNPLSERQDVTGESSQKLKYFDPTTSITTSTDINVLIQPLGVAGLKKYSFNDSGYPFLTIWDIRQSLTYAQYTRWSQSMEWRVELDIPSKCNEVGEYNEFLTYGLDNLPIEAVYVKDKASGIWVQQTFSICSNQDDYVNRTNEDGPGDTFVERSEYIKNNKTIQANEAGSFQVDTGLFEQDVDGFSKQIEIINEVKEKEGEFKFVVDYNASSTIKELRFVNSLGQEILLTPVSETASPLGKNFVRLEYIINDFTSIGNNDTFFDPKEKLLLIKKVSTDIGDSNESIQHNYVSPNKVKSPKVGINKVINP